MATPLFAPQLVINATMLYFGWVPADAAAVDALIPQGLRPHPDRRVFMNQYFVADENQTSHFGTYSLTYLGADVLGLDTADGVSARWWTHYLNSSERINSYASRGSGVPAAPGRTVLESSGDIVTATTYRGDKPKIRTTVRIGKPSDQYVRAHLRYITKLDNRFVSGRYPAIGQCSDTFSILDLEFLDPNDPLHALRPARPLNVLWGFYFHKASFCYPGGQEPLTEAEIVSARTAS